MASFNEPMSTLRQAAASPARESLELLLEGNERFASGCQEYPHQSEDWRNNLYDGQRPSVAVLSCSDSRVPPELVFDTGLGDLFTIRTAGHVVDTSVLASLEFAIEVLKVSLIAVVGHEDCGAIKAAVQEFTAAGKPKSFVSSNFLVNSVLPGVHAAFDHGSFDNADVEREHLKSVSVNISTKCGPLRDGLANGTLGIATMRYELRSGHVELLSALLP